MAQKKIPAQEFLKDVLDYNPETGILVWCKRNPRDGLDPGYIDRWNARYAGLTAGYINEQGYHCVTVQRIKCRACRLIFVYMTGKQPDGEVDHINGNPSDDRWINLHDTTGLGNKKNLKTSKRNKSGRKGVFNLSNGMFMTHIYANGHANTKRFATFAEAVAQREAWEQQFFGEFTRGSGRINPLAVTVTSTP